MSTAPKRRITEAEYVAIERQAGIKSDFIDGRMHARAGRNRNHCLILTNTVSELSNQLRKKPCEVYNSDMRVKVARTGLYTYPDVVVVCGEPEFLDDEEDTLLNPTLIIEVLSDSTARYVRTFKAARYRKLPSLRQYVIVEQEEPLIEVYTRSPDDEWTLKDAAGLTDSVTVKSIRCQLPLASVFEKVTFPDRPEGPKPGPR
jgi:Uma2 family endonuclease